jgi:hypothetical protein
MTSGWSAVQKTTNPFLHLTRTLCYAQKPSKCADSQQFSCNLMLYAGLPKQGWDAFLYESIDGLADPEKALAKWAGGAAVATALPPLADTRDGCSRSRASGTAAAAGGGSGSGGGGTDATAVRGSRLLPLVGSIVAAVCASSILRAKHA